MKKIINPYYVLIWDINKNNIRYYDIMPYLISEYKADKKSRNKIFDGSKKVYNGIKEFILNASKYRFWSRCEYEILVDGFPPTNSPKKIDVYNQIEANIDVITSHFINQL